MSYSPKQKNPKGLTAAVVSLFAIAVILYSVPSALAIKGINVPPIIFMGIGLIIFVAAIYLILRFCMTKFEYVIKERDDGYGGEVMARAFGDDAPLDFVVYKAMGTRQAAMECVLALSDFVEAIPLGEEGVKLGDVTKAYKNDGFAYFDYTLTFRAKKNLMLIFANGDGFVGIVIESDNVIADYFVKLQKNKEGT